MTTNMVTFFSKVKLSIKRPKINVIPTENPLKTVISAKI